MLSVRRVVLVAVLAVLAIHHAEAGFGLKKLAKAALFGAAIAPRFVPIPIPHHVHSHHHGHHDHGHHGHHHHVKEHHIHVPLHHHKEHHGHHEVVHHDEGHGWDQGHGGW